MKTKTTFLTLITTIIVTLSSCNSSENNTSKTENESLEGVIEINNKLDNPYYKALFRAFEDNDPVLQNWNDSLIGKEIVTEVFVKYKQSTNNMYFSIWNRDNNRYELLGKLYSETAIKNDENSIYFEFNLADTAKLSDQLLDSNGSIGLVWDTKNQKPLTQNKAYFDQMEKSVGKQTIDKYSIKKDCDNYYYDIERGLRKDNDDYYIDLKSVSEYYSNLKDCYSQSIADEFKSGIYFTIQAATNYYKEREPICENFIMFDPKGKVDGYFLQKIKIKGTVEKISMSKGNWPYFHLRDAKILNISETPLLAFLKTLKPKPITVGGWPSKNTSSSDENNIENSEVNSDELNLNQE